MICPENDMLFERLGIIKLKDIYKTQVLLFMYKANNNMLPDCCLHHVHIAI